MSIKAELCNQKSTTLIIEGSLVATQYMDPNQRQLIVVIVVLSTCVAYLFFPIVKDAGHSYIPQQNVAGVAGSPTFKMVSSPPSTFTLPSNHAESFVFSIDTSTSFNLAVSALDVNNVTSTVPSGTSVLATLADQTIAILPSQNLTYIPMVATF